MSINTNSRGLDDTIYQPETGLSPRRIHYRDFDALWHSQATAGFFIGKFKDAWKRCVPLHDRTRSRSARTTKSLQRRSAAPEKTPKQWQLCSVAFSPLLTSQHDDPGQEHGVGEESGRDCGHTYRNCGMTEPPMCKQSAHNSRSSCDDDEWHKEAEQT